jgi:type IV secretion system protein VirB10
MSAGSTSSGNYSSAGSGSSNSDPDLERAQAALRDSNAAVAAASAAAGQPDSGGGLSASTGSSSRGDLSSLTGNSYAMAKAYKAPNGKFLLKRRSRFQCVLYDAVRTDHPGFVSCYLTRPLLSSDGSVILAEAGAEINGEQSVDMKAGQTSVFTTWTDLETTGGKDGVRARLNGLGTGPMGTSGTDAYVDNHWGQRIGGSVMLSGTQDVLKSLSNLTQKSGSGYTVNNSEQNTEDMASKLLENSMNIPPTGYLLPGTVINVIVAQDVDFSSVYTTR